jgi:predicted DNA-binding protein with PD1-like motif
MEIQQENNVVVAKFVEGKILKNIEELMNQQGFDAAVILSGIGMLKNVVIGYFDGETYIEEQIKNPVELVALQGNIGREIRTRKIVSHLHVALADQDHSLKGGHLLKGEVMVVNEIILQIFDNIKILRKKNSKGLLEMTMQP